MRTISRTTARVNRLMRYYTGKPCCNGHMAERYTNSADCVACVRARSNTWKTDNPDKYRDVCTAAHRSYGGGR